jgi:hypothetical protein
MWILHVTDARFGRIHPTFGLDANSVMTTRGKHKDESVGGLMPIQLSLHSGDHTFNIQMKWVKELWGLLCLGVWHMGKSREE